MFTDEYAALDGTDLAEALQRGLVTAEELRVTAIECIGSVNTSLNAVVGDILPPRPRIDGNGEFTGVPFGVKDLVCHAEGVLHESGSELSLGFVPGYDTTLMDRWRRAGLDLLCRTTTPEFGLSCSTESRATGVTRNPWDLTRSPGGSSGGSAALVAAGALPWAHANDAAGSNRTPAALCGLVGLKPTRGRIPSGPDSDDPLFGLSTEFAVTRTVRDSAALLDAVQGTEPGDRFQIAPPLTKYRNTGKVPGRRLRIAYLAQSPFGGTVDPAYERITKEVAGILGGLGHDVVEAEPALDPDQFIDMSVRFWSASVSETVRDLTRNRPESTVMSLLQATTAAFTHRGRSLTWHDVAQARSWQNVLTRQTARHFDSYDIQLTPTVARPAWPVGLLKPDDPAIGPEAWMRQLFELAPFTPLYNITGQPAISLPVGMEGELPLGIQLAAAQGREDLLFSISFELERHMPWSHRRPKTHVLNRQQNRTEVAHA